MILILSTFRTSGSTRGLESQRRQTASSGEVPRALVTDNNEPRLPGRPTDEERDCPLVGERVRNNSVLLLATHNFRRPINSNMRVNAQGHIYMNY